MTAEQVRTELRPVLARHVTLTNLPLGGAVLLDTVTLDLIELGEPDAYLLDRVVAGTVPPQVPADYVNRLVGNMLRNGWLVAPTSQEGS
ncbi:actinodefensin-associated protein B [Micromonospora sp. NPDC047134]|uniref:actinodefensin-associated protein B n=1 Tax=Micromonospora sp. NPDC047134 TaxID=3154340 RepID=UPI0033FE8B99